jgi:hypothetical protein
MQFYVLLAFVFVFFFEKYFNQINVVLKKRKRINMNYIGRIFERKLIKYYDCKISGRTKPFSSNRIKKDDVSALVKRIEHTQGH